MEDAARDSAVDTLVRDSDAVRDSVEIVRLRRSGGRVTVLARWAEAPTGRSRRGAVDVAKTHGDQPEDGVPTPTTTRITRCGTPGAAVGSRCQARSLTRQPPPS